MMFQCLTRTNSPFCEDFSEKVSCFGLRRAERREDAFSIVFINEQCSHTQYLSLVLYGIQLTQRVILARSIVWTHDGFECVLVRPSRSQMKIWSEFRSTCAEFTKRDNGSMPRQTGSRDIGNGKDHRERKVSGQLPPEDWPHLECFSQVFSGHGGALFSRE